MWDDTLIIYWSAILVARIPLLIVELSVLVCCLSRMQRYPRECKLMMLIIFLTWFGDCVLPILMSQVLNYLTQYDVIEYSRLRWVFAYNAPSAFVSSVIWGLMLFAVFGKNRMGVSRYLVEDDVR